MRSNLVMLCMLCLANTTLGANHYTSISKTKGAIIPIKSKAVGAWEILDNRYYKLLGLKEINVAFGMVKGRMLIESVFDQVTDSGYYVVKSCDSTGVMNFCKEIEVHKVYDYDNVLFKPKNAKTLEIETISRESDKTTTEKSILIIE